MIKSIISISIIAVEFKANFVTFDFLIRESDFVFISCALTDDTREIFDAGVFSKMKNSAVLVNVARGEIIKQPDLVDALKNGGIFAAGLDVFTPEPLPQGHELLNLPNCGKEIKYVYYYIICYNFLQHCFYKPKNGYFST